MTLLPQARCDTRAANLPGDRVMGQLLKHSPIHVLEVGPANDARFGRVAFGFDRHLKVDVEVVPLTVPKIGQGLNILKKSLANKWCFLPSAPSKTSVLLVY